GGDGIHAHFAASVEAVPAKPQQARAEGDQRDAVRAGIGRAPLSYVDDGSKGGDTGDVVDDDAAGEILHSPLLQEATAPNHVHEGEVNEGEPGCQKQHVGLEGDAVGEGSGDKGRCDDGEHHLIGDEDESGNRVISGGWRAEIDSAEEGEVEVANDSVPVAAETQRVAVEVPDDGGPAHGDEALNHDGQDVLAAHQSAI